MSYSIGAGDMRKAMDIYLFLKKFVKNISNKYSQKLVDIAKRSATDAIKTASKRAIQKTAAAIGDLIGNKIADKLQAFQRSCNQKNLQGNCIQKNYSQVKLIIKYQKKDIYLHKKDNKLLMN